MTVTAPPFPAAVPEIVGCLEVTLAPLVGAVTPTTGEATPAPSTSATVRTETPRPAWSPSQPRNVSSTPASTGRYPALQVS